MSATEVAHIHGIAVLVLNWNGEHVIRECLSSLNEQTYPSYDVWIVDNASSDASCEIITCEYPWVHLLKLPENTGFARGNNIGIREILKQNPALPYIALLNNDTRVSPDWLERLAGAADSDERIGSVASKMLCWDGTNRPEVIDTAGDMFYKHGLAGKRGHAEPAERFSEREDVFGACAGAALYRAAMLEEVGLFDEDFFAYNEDVDLSFRARMAGWRCVYEPNAVVWHRVSFTTVKFSDKALFWAKRNSVWVMIKNLPGRFFIRHIFSILGYNILSDIPWILRGRWRPVMKGRWDAFKKLGEMRLKRKRIQTQRKITARELERWIEMKTPWRESILRNVKNIDHISADKQSDPDMEK